MLENGYWPLGGGAPRAATHYLYTIGLDNYTRSFYGCTSLKIHIKEHNSAMVEGRDSSFPFIHHSAGSPCPGWRRSSPPWWPFGGSLTAQAVPEAQELSCLVGSHSRFI